MSVHYATMHLAPAERFRYWKDVVCRTLVPAQGRPEEQSSFDARMTTRCCGPITVSTVSAPAQYWVRGARDLRRAPHDEFLVSLMLRGEGCLTQSGREVVQRPGIMILYDTSREFSYRVAADIVLLKIPRRLLVVRAPSAARLAALPFAGDTPVGGLAAGLMRQVAALDLPDRSPAAAKLGASLLDVLGAALDDEPAAQRSGEGGQSPVLERIQVYMRERLGDPRLDTVAVARANDISPRTLARLFAAAGTTPMRWLWAQRVEAGYCMLREGWVRSVTDVALESGFSDLSHFSRFFKSVYGVSPSSLIPRRAAAAWRTVRRPRSPAWPERIC